MLYDRTALSKNPEETIAQKLATLRDTQRMMLAPVMPDSYNLAWHKCIQIDDEDFQLDLLF